ncbi:VOC family protein [Actinospica robiniae]|uniref:VOC family protein n=1 Tax=Actinospica robiniae TaxID=304901 RepID=UPI00041ABDBC|nr:VOC family protein [Actinospica robiniae]
MIDHVSVQVRDFAASCAFYDSVLAPLGGRRLMDEGDAVGYGTEQADFWISDKQSREPAAEVHLAFSAATRDQVHAFYAAALATGTEIMHAPRVWPEYHEFYFAVFVRDPDGNNVEAVCHAPEG